jgi:hypothetical protein
MRSYWEMLLAKFGKAAITTEKQSNHQFNTLVWHSPTLLQMPNNGHGLPKACGKQECESQFKIYCLQYITRELYEADIGFVPEQTWSLSGKVCWFCRWFEFFYWACKYSNDARHRAPIERLARVSRCEQENRKFSSHSSWRRKPVNNQPAFHEHLAC